VTAATRLVALALTLSGCAYYNAMWSAERFAKEARQLEARGREPEARAQWGLAAMKAESVMTRHPHSRWADDALVLRGEGLARAGRCDAAAAPIAEALAKVSDAPLRERAGLAAAHCALMAGKPVDAERALGEALASDDAARRSRAEYLAGRAAASRLDYDQAMVHFRRSREPAALPARARALLAAGRPGDAGAVLDTLAAGRFSGADWTELLDGLAAAGGGGADAASAALNRLLARARVPAAEAARLLVADGDRRFARGDLDGAAARYRQAAVTAPVIDAGVARVREQRVVAARVAARSDLGPVVAEVTRIVRSGDGGGSGAGDARRLLDLLAQVAATPETPGAAFRAAELARDSLSAPRLAGRLFLDLAAADTASLFAPKALVAALPLVPDRHDSIIGVLDGAYAASPYTRALRGEATPAYAAAEDSLARELGVQLVRGVAGAAASPSAFRTGPRGPWLEDAPTPGRPAPAAGRGRARPDDRGRRVPTERPQERPTGRPARS
jgi:hypothetical protein